MKKCVYCGVLNEDTREACMACGCTEFTGASETEYPDRTLLRSRLPAERRGGMIFLKCRSPEEATLVREKCLCSEVIALLPDEQEIWRQYTDRGFVEVQIPASYYETNTELRSMVEFATYVPPSNAVSVGMKAIVLWLGFMVFPGVIFFLWLLLTNFAEKGQRRQARVLILWFLLGVALWPMSMLVQMFLTPGH